MNRIILLGRLTADPECRYTNSGKTVTSFTLAVDRPYTGQDGNKETDFINCQIWGKSAEALANNVSKGRRILVEGRLQIRKYTAKDNSTRYATEVVCDRFFFVDGKDGGKTNQPANNQEAGFGAMGTPVPFDEEIPF